ncbi:protease [Baekduia alba]|uniref:S8 family peptidase n=1 Tax=Baekduia alba TaxID=2997333 RepID=UPI00233FC103|nr:S8 family serine peptidase [Baekduia alba]WCB92832.1 protease [Baekduia alba]
MSRTTPLGPAVLVALVLALAAPEAHARWLVAAQPSAVSDRIASEHGARPLRLRGVYSVATPGARGLARAFARAGVLRYAERDAALAPASTYEAAGSDQTYTRGTVIAAGLVPPAAFAPIGLVDDVVDRSVTDVGQAKVIASSPTKALDAAGQPITAHGTEVASVAAARADGQGVIGIAPGAPLLSYGYDERSDPTCEEVVDGVLDLAGAGAKVINLSLETEDDCHTLQLAIGSAFGDGALIVASAGNEGERGSPTTYPAAYPHVLTVGALDVGLAPASFSNAGAGVDVVAPGESVPVALPAALDGDGTADGLTRATGTSFAAPIVSGVAAWLIAARPKLTAGQYGDLLRATAQDEGAAGWDARSGFGLVDLAAALKAPLPAADRAEPNDGVDMVDGSVFTKPDPYRSGTVTATIAPVEDPADVYRIRVKARGRATARLSGGDGANVYAYPGKVKSLAARPLARSRTQVTVRNATGTPATFYVAVRAPAGAARASASSAYTLKIARR